MHLGQKVGAQYSNENHVDLTRAHMSFHELLAAGCCLLLLPVLRCKMELLHHIQE